MTECFEVRRLFGIKVRPIELQAQTIFSRARRVKSSKAGLLGALNTSADFLVTEIAVELPATFWDVLDAVNWFHVDGIGYCDFWDPDSAEQMSPRVGSSLFESASFDWTQYAGL